VAKYYGVKANLKSRVIVEELVQLGGTSKNALSAPHIATPIKTMHADFEHLNPDEW